MTVTNPHIISTPIVSATGTLTSASQVQANDDNSVETRLSNLDTLLAQVSALGIAWNFSNLTTVDPDNQTFRFNNTDPTQATLIYLDVQSLSGNFTEFLTQFATGGFLFLQDSTNTGNSYLFTTSGSITLQGGSTGYFNVPITFESSNGTLGAVNGDRFEFTFIPVSAAGGSLPNRFLSEIQEVGTNTFVNRVDVPADSSFVRFWLRSAIVTPSTVNTPGVGLVISEANGTLDDDGPTFSQATDSNNDYIYLTLPDAFVTGTALSTLYVVIKNADGTIAGNAPFVSSFILQTDIDGSVAGRPYRSTGGLNGGSRLHYEANQTIELFFVTVDQFFDIPEANADNVDITRGVKNLPESALSDEVITKLNYNHGIPDDDQFKLDQFVEVSTTTASGGITSTDSVYYKLGAFTNEVTDYYTTDFDTGLPPSFDQSTTWTVAVPHNYTIESLQGVESGTGTATLVKDDVLINGVPGTYNVYRCVVPPVTSATNFFEFVGTVTTITEIDPSSLIKIDRTNIQDDFLPHIENTQGNTVDSQRLASLEQKVGTLYVLAPDIDALQNWGDIYTPQRAVNEVVITQGYDLIADYRGPTSGTERYESAGVTYDDSGTNVVRYTGLSNSTHRAFGFQVPAPANQTLLWVVDGSELIPFIDMTSGGNYRVNNYTPAQTATETVTNQTTQISPGAGTNGIITLSQAAIFILPAFPVGATDVSRSVQIEFEILIDGVDTFAGHLQSIPVPATDLVQDRIDITVDIPLGPTRGNTVARITVGYRFALPTPGEYRLVLSLRDAQLIGTETGTVTVQTANDAFIFRTYTAPTTVARVDNFVILQDENGNYTFTGENELLVAFHPLPNGITTEVVPAAITSTGTVSELNDSITPIPHVGFSTVEIPDTTALVGFEFRTFNADHFLIHRELSNFLRDRSVEFAYGIARNRQVATIHAVTEAIDLASGSTLNGVAISTGGGGGLAPLTVYEAQNLTTGANGLINVTTLPANYATYDFVHLSEFDNSSTEWRHTDISTDLLESGLVDSNHNVRLQGATDMLWDSAARTLTLVGGAQELALVKLYSVS